MSDDATDLMARPKWDLWFDEGSLCLQSNQHQGQIPMDLTSLSQVHWDARIQAFRTFAYQYRQIIETFKASSTIFSDQARGYETIRPDETAQAIVPRQHQQEAMGAWWRAGGRGVVCLPTGAGKTILALMVMRSLNRSTLIVVPTIDLMHQWEIVVDKFYTKKIGLWGGGQQTTEAVVISTFDSAYLKIAKFGSRFGCLIVDECHHLPGERYQDIARFSLAPFRLGLSATIERSDQRHELLHSLLGPVVYQGKVQNLIGQGLSPYDVVQIKVNFTEDEATEYNQHRKVYTDFIKKHQLRFSQPQDWQKFVALSARSAEGKKAFYSYRMQKKMALNAQEKFRVLWKIFQKHPLENMILFTEDNEMAYRIGSMFLLPVITHKTKLKERKYFLDAFRSGELKILVSSKVLNEGVDVPQASIGIIVSGSGVVREHVQRLGRILRQDAGKKAVLYEIVTENSSEIQQSRRRREHDAYQAQPLDSSQNE